jgi:hypothetical protein
VSGPLVPILLSAKATPLANTSADITSNTRTSRRRQSAPFPTPPPKRLHSR